MKVVNKVTLMVTTKTVKTITLNHMCSTNSEAAEEAPVVGEGNLKVPLIYGSLKLFWVEKRFIQPLRTISQGP